MKFLLTLFVAFSITTISTADLKAQDVVVMQEQDGPWRAACYRNGAVEAPYCRIFVINVFGANAKSSNFVQFGPAFDRGNIGFVFATYYGFAPESTVKVKIDDHEKHILKTSENNHTIAPLEISRDIYQQMIEGKAITVDFKLSTGTKSVLDFPLSGFKNLHEKVTAVLTQSDG